MRRCVWMAALLYPCPAYTWYAWGSGPSLFSNCTMYQLDATVSITLIRIQVPRWGL